jgi:hypothetical protein
MAKKSQETSLPLLISTVAFALLTIGLGVFCYTLYSDQEAKDKAVADAKKEVAAARATARDQELTARIGRIYIGVEDEEDRKVVGTEVKEGDKAAQALKALNDTLAQKLPGDKLPPEFGFWPAEFDPSTKTLRLPAKAGGLVDAVVATEARRRAAEKELAAAKKAYDDTRLAMDASKKGYDAAQAEYKTAAAKAPQDFKEALEANNKQVEKFQKAFEGEIAKARADEQALKDEVQQRKIELARAEAKLSGVQEDLKNLLARQQATQDVFQFDDPQGKITRRVSENMVEIDLGSSALVREGLTFTVLPMDFPERGRQSRMREIRVPDERGRYHSVQRFVPKATVEVVEVLGPNLSRARITQEADPIRDRAMPGDLLYNSVWRKGHADRIALLGIFDVNGDGSDDIEAVVRDLVRMGVPVDAYFNLRTQKWEGRLTEQTRYLVEGAFPTSSASDPHQAAKTVLIGAMSDARKEATNKGINVVGYRDFFPRMGYRVKIDVTEDRINQAAARYLAPVTAPPEKPDGN